MSTKKDENAKKTILFTVLAIIFFLFGPFAILFLIIGVIGHICFKAKKNSSKNEIFKNGSLSGYDFRNKLVDNIVTIIRDNTRDVKFTAKPYCQRARQQRYDAPQLRYLTAFMRTPSIIFDLGGGNAVKLSFFVF